MLFTKIRVTLATAVLSEYTNVTDRSRISNVHTVTIAE